ncbi:hypothetical protein BTIS_0487 [Bifidobacterium tissieri]|uniref:DNA and RNA helicase-like protein n=1 Tax=Bifidobacterium tissieri TaxID=1630162 RepID=A0A261FIT2_9BIFI|nr:hypothetical protein [Bifidobacterium tissieri]OZG58766.1 hypothetical protein BTIS_0487 [Bifidobacterium tissieri]
MTNSVNSMDSSNSTVRVVDASGERSGRRKHRRVVFKGTERFDADGLFDAESSADPDELRERANKSSDDDQRILTELPPHWAKFDAEGRR